MQISYETAKLAKEKGFDESCEHVYEDEDSRRLNYYEGDGSGFVKNSEIDKKYVDYELTLPTQSELQKWLREVHKLHPNIIFHPNPGWEFVILSNLDNGRTWVTYKEKKLHDTYEQALEEGLVEALKLIKTC